LITIIENKNQIEINLNLNYLKI